jgi:hypothetical protein
LLSVAYHVSTILHQVLLLVLHLSLHLLLLHCVHSLVLDERMLLLLMLLYWRHLAVVCMLHIGSVRHSSARYLLAHLRLLPLDGNLLMPVGHAAHRWQSC